MENRLIAGNGASLSYDPLGRLDTVAKSGATTRFLYDGNEAVLEYDGSGAVQRRYYWGPWTNYPILQDDGAALNCSGTKMLHTDRLGSVVAAADCWGNRASINRYDEYGRPASGNVGRYQYTGQAWLAELGLHYYKARMYDPRLGRFLQTDPIGYADGMNWYAYVKGDPVNKTDPSGTEELNSDMEVNVCAGISVTEKKTGTSRCVRLNGRGLGRSSGLGWFGSGGWTLSASAGLAEGKEGDTPGAGQQGQQSPCEKALAQPGKIEYAGNTGSLILLGGLSVSWGKWRNLQTGSFGSYRTVGAGVGLGLGVTRDYGYARSLADFVGYGETASAGGSIGPVGGSYSWTQNAAGDVVSQGGSLGYSPSTPSVGYGKLGVSATATAGETFISRCNVRGQQKTKR